MPPMHIHDLDLNLLRLFDAVATAGSVSRAAGQLGLTQPAASQGLSRLRVLLHDPLFVRRPGGVSPTPRAERMAPLVRGALVALSQAVDDSARFDPLRSDRTFRLHMSDIGEARFLPELMQALQRQAPRVRIETVPLPATAIAAALDSGQVDLAVGYLPEVRDTERLPLLQDRYILLLRAGHPFARTRKRGAALLEGLQALDFVAVRSHADTLRILQLLRLEHRLRLVPGHFMVLPSIVRATDLAVVMPRNIARTFAAGGGYAIVEPAFPLRDFAVALHWSRRFAADPGCAWLRGVVTTLFQEPAPAGRRRRAPAPGGPAGPGVRGPQR